MRTSRGGAVCHGTGGWYSRLYRCLGAKVWVPALGGKVDAVPGFTTYTWFKALHANELYHGQCAQLCGRQHAFMTALVKVVTPSQYETWFPSLAHTSEQIERTVEAATAAFACLSGSAVR